MSVLGNSVLQQSFTPAVDYFSGNGSTTAFTLSRSVAAAGQVVAVIENVPQSPYDAFTVNGNTITFTSAPPSGSNNIYVYYTTLTTQYVQPTDGSVGLRQLNSDMQGALYGYKNRIINGGMTVDQRFSGAATVSSYTGYVVDRWSVNQITTGKLIAQQNAGGITPPAGFRNYLGVTSQSAYSVTTGDLFWIQQNIEGYNAADLMFGTASAATVTLSFWVRSSLTGTFGGALSNSGTRSYPFTYTINAANTWEQKSITIAGDQSGTWATTNGVGLSVLFGLGAGSTYSGAAGSWQSINIGTATGAVSVVGTAGATFYITGVQLEKGTTATAFDFREYGEELRRCQRYFEKLYVKASGYGNGSNTLAFQVAMKVSKRAAATGTIGSDPEGWLTNFPTAAVYCYDADTATVQNATTVSATGLARFGGIVSLSAEL